MISYDEYQIADLILTIKKHLTPDLLAPEFRDINKTNPMYGHCYVASEALWHMVDWPSKVKIRCGKDENGIVHWWLRDVQSGTLFDATSEQYTQDGKEPPYYDEKSATFLTQEPSARARELIERVKNDYTS